MWPTKTIKNMDEFEEIVEPLKKSNPMRPSVCFRGQSVADWDLKPSLCRHLPEALSSKQAFELEYHSILEFQKQAHLVLNSLLLPNSDSVMDWLSLMQHYNAPTRLLDWSYSPYVALYFAVQNNFTSDGALWYFDNTILDHATSVAYGKDYFWSDPDWKATKHAYIPTKSEWRALNDSTENMLFEFSSYRIPKNPNLCSERLISQQGTFTVSKSVKADHSDAIEKGMTLIHARKPDYYTQDIISTNYSKVIIESSSKKQILRKLNEMNINASSLFPGVDGLGRSIAGLINIHLDWLLNTPRSDEEISAMFNVQTIYR